MVTNSKHNLLSPGNPDNPGQKSSSGKHFPLNTSYYNGQSQHPKYNFNLSEEESLGRMANDSSWFVLWPYWRTERQSKICMCPKTETKTQKTLAQQNKWLLEGNCEITYTFIHSVKNCVNNFYILGTCHVSTGMRKTWLWPLRNSKTKNSVLRITSHFIISH